MSNLTMSKKQMRELEGIVSRVVSKQPTTTNRNRQLRTTSAPAAGRRISPQAAFPSQNVPRGPKPPATLADVFAGRAPNVRPEEAYHPTATEAKTCRKQKVYGRVELTVAAGGEACVVFNPRLAHTDIMPINSSVNTADQPPALATVFTNTYTSGTTKLSSGSTQFPLTGQYNSLASAVNGFGSGYSRFISMKVRVKQNGTALNQGGTVWANRGETEAGLGAWDPLTSAADFITSDEIKTMELTSATTLSNEWTEMLVGPTSREDLEFDKIPANQTQGVEVTVGVTSSIAGVMNESIYPSQVGERSLNNWRCALVISPAPLATTQQIMLEFEACFDNHRISPQASLGTAMNLPTIPDDMTVNADPVVAAQVANELTAMAEAFKADPAGTSEAWIGAAKRWVSFAKDIYGAGSDIWSFIRPQGNGRGNANLGPPFSDVRIASARNKRGRYHTLPIGNGSAQY